MATHSSILAWKLPWTEEPGGLQSMGSQRVGHDWVVKHTGDSEETLSKADYSPQCGWASSSQLKVYKKGLWALEEGGILLQTALISNFNFPCTSAISSVNSLKQISPNPSHPTLVQFLWENSNISLPRLGVSVIVFRKICLLEFSNFQRTSTFLES